MYIFGLVIKDTGRTSGSVSSIEQTISFQFVFPCEGHSPWTGTRLSISSTSSATHTLLVCLLVVQLFMLTNECVDTKVFSKAQMEAADLWIHGAQIPLEWIDN